MTITEAVKIFFSGEKLVFGKDEHIVARNMLRRLKKNTKEYRVYIYALTMLGNAKIL